MKLAYDLHIHTCLSPCGDDDMTPNNIVNMAILKGLDVIAITDHNSCGNVLACMKAAEGKDIIVLPGMEVETAEEVHMVCLFENIEMACEFEAIVKKSMSKIKNNEDIFGRQVYVDENDNITGFEENMLVTASGLSVCDVERHIAEIGGVVFPAHVDKTSYSIISNLGFIPEESRFNTVEVKDFLKYEDLKKQYKLDKYKTISNSDAHYLWDISERSRMICVKSKKINDILKIL